MLFCKNMLVSLKLRDKLRNFTVYRSKFANLGSKGLLFQDISLALNPNPKGYIQKFFHFLVSYPLNTKPFCSNHKSASSDYSHLNNIFLVQVQI